MPEATTDQPYQAFRPRRIAWRLVELYEVPYGGKQRGRYRLSMKHLRQIADRKRLYGEHIAAISRELYELSYVLIDMETFFVVLSQRTFTNYRRVNDSALRSSQRSGPSAEPGSTRRERS